MLAFDQFYIMTAGGPRGQTFTAVYWIYQNSFIKFQLGYGAALSIVLTLIIIVFADDADRAHRRGAPRHDRGRAVDAPERAISTPRRRGARLAGATSSVAACVAVIAIMAAPIALSFLASIKTAADASAVPPNYLPQALSLENYAKVIHLPGGPRDLCRQSGAGRR